MLGVWILAKDNSFKEVLEQLDKTAELLDLDPNVLEQLKHPRRVLMAAIPIKTDSGKVHVFLSLDDVLGFLFLSQEIICGIHSDFIYPAFETFSFFISVEVSVHFNQSILADFLGLFSISCHSISHVQKPQAIRPEKKVKGGLVSFKDFANQFIFILHPH